MKRVWNKRYINLQEPENITTLLKEIALRPTYSRLANINFVLPNPDPILKAQGRDIAIYRDLLSDAHVWSNVQSRKAGVLSMEWEIDRGKSKSRVAKFINNILSDRDFNLNGVISEILDAPLFGYQPLEVLWEKRGDFLIPVQVVGKPQEWFVFDQDNRLRYRPPTGPANGILLPERKFLLPRFSPSYQNPYGEAALSRCFWPVMFKKGGWKFWVIFTEKFGMPFILGKYRRGEEDSNITALLDMLEAMVQDAVAAIPDDSSVEIITNSGSVNGEIYQGLITVCNSEISKALLGQTLTTEMGSTGSFAASKTHQEVRQDIVDADRRIVESQINRLIEWIVQLNFGENTEPPTFGLWEEEDVDKDLAERDRMLTDAGVQFTKVYFQKNYGFDEEDLEVSIPTTAGQPPIFAENSKLREKFRFDEINPNPSSLQDQKALDDFIDSLPPEELQSQMEAVLQPVLDFINGASNYEEVMAKTAELYPDMDTSQLEDLLQRAIFVAEVWGRLNADLENQ